ncbi:MAG: UDP-galactopyranose mutase [Prevotella sp.]|nr:UDP-galactopyranose mutase [Prevotella sp.]
MKQQYDYLIVGAGLYGATFAHQAKLKGKSCLVIDKRPHVGGNVYCKEVEGIHVHQYGAHIFHTDSQQVWHFVNSLVPFNRHTNSPVANYKGRLYNLPFNMNTFHQMWGCTTPDDARQKIDEQRREALEALDGGEARNLEERALLLVGRDIYETLIKGYTEKQWGRRCCDLPAFIIRRLPLRFVNDNNYFNDRYQGIPEGGYNKLISKLLDGTETRTDADFFADRAHWERLTATIVFTGCIDEYYGYRYGRLDYRTLRFEHELLPTPNYQGNAVVNYTDSDTPFTRIIEHKHFEMFGQAVYDSPSTVITREYPSEWTAGQEPFYPVNDEKNNQLAARYQQLARQEQHVVFGGRLAEYKYNDMAPVMERAMLQCSNVLSS